jgi:chaperone modulatory protein CbpM
MAERDEGVWLHEYREISLVELADCSGFSEDELRELVDYGALLPRHAADDLRFGADCVKRMRAALRLRRDLELEMSAVALIVSFLERIDELDERVRKLDAQVRSD